VTLWTDTDPTRTLTWPHGERPRDALLIAFAGALRHAAESAEGFEEDPVVAVHEYRRAMRRARSLLHLSRGALGAPYDDLNHTMSWLERATERARDEDLLLGLLDNLAPFDVPEERWGRDRIRQRFLSRDAARDTLAAADALIEGAATAPVLVDLLARALPKDYHWADMCTGLLYQYRGVRRKRDAADGLREDASVYSWRKWVKELRYQLEWLATASDQRRVVKRLRDDFEDLSEGLGEVTDEILVRRVAERELGERVVMFTIGLNGRIQRKLKVCIETAAPLLTREPGQFAADVVDEART